MQLRQLSTMWCIVPVWNRRVWAVLGNRGPWREGSPCKCVQTAPALPGQHQPGDPQETSSLHSRGKKTGQYQSRTFKWGQLQYNVVTFFLFYTYTLLWPYQCEWHNTIYFHMRWSVFLWEVANCATAAWWQVSWHNRSQIILSDLVRH